MPERHFFKCALSFVLFVIFLLTTLFTTIIDLPAKTVAVQQASKNCLWSIQSQSNKIYLLGSLHLLKSDDYPLSASINKAYAQSQLLVFETDLEAMLKPAILMKFQELGMYPQGENLLKNLDAHTRTLLEKKMAEIGLPLAIYNQFKPWLVAQDLALRELRQLGFNPIYGIDVYFFNKAKADGKEIEFLESPEFQLNLLGTMVAQDQNNFLSQTLNELDVVNDLSNDMVKFWKAGDAQKLHELLYKSFKEYPEIHDRLLIQRNIKWVKKVEDAMRKNKNVFFVVGAGHLVGPESVVDLLRKNGHEVKQQ